MKKISVSDPDPHWIRNQQTQGSGSGIRIPNADPGSGSSILIFTFSTGICHPLGCFCVILHVVIVVLQGKQKIPVVPVTFI